MNKILVCLFLILTFLGTANGQKKKKKDKGQEAPVTSVRLYDGPQLPDDQLARLTCPNDGKKYGYFISLDSVPIPSQSLTRGPQDIRVLPGQHKVKMRFVSPGEVAIPIEAFDAITFDAGATYIVKFDHTPGEGGYPQNIGTTRVRIWIERDGQVVAEQVVNGFGKRAP